MDATDDHTLIIKINTQVRVDWCEAFYALNLFCRFFHFSLLMRPDVNTLIRFKVI